MPDADMLSLLSPEQRALVASVLSGGAGTVPTQAHPASLLNPMQQSLIAPYQNLPPPSPPPYTPSPGSNGSDNTDPRFKDFFARFPGLPDRIKDIFVSKLRTGSASQPVRTDQTPIQFVRDRFR